MRWLEVFAGASLSLGCSEAKPPADEAPRAAIEQLKSAHAPDDFALDDELRAELSNLNARAAGLPSDWRARAFDEALAADPELKSRLRPTQLASYRALAAGDHDAVVSWDREAIAPEYLEPGLVFRGQTGEQARVELEARIGGVLSGLFALAPEDTLVVYDERTIELPARLANERPLVVHEVQYAREHDGRPVFGDWYVVSLTQSHLSSSAWHARVSARWTPSLAREKVVISETEAVEAARAAGELRQGTVMGPVRLGYARVRGVLRPAYEVSLNAGHEQWSHHVSAETGELLAKHAQSAANHSGSLKINVSRPHEDTKNPRALPSAYIYEDSAFELGAPGCGYGGGGQNQWMGQSTQNKGTTTYSGGYSNLVDYDPLDLSWTVDFKGPYVKDISANFTTLNMASFPAGGDYTFPTQTSYARNRRGEVFYLANYGHNVYKSWGLPQYEPLGFTYYTFDPTTVDAYCAAPDSLATCCSGYTKAGCIYVECGMGPEGAPLAERRFREVALHEQNHTLRLKAAAGAFCTGCNGTAAIDGTECGCWEEGRADFGALSLNRFEKARPEFDPDRRYPDDYSTALYVGGSMWTAIYVEYMLRTGTWAIGDVNKNLELIDQNTRMVGSCASASDWATCPANSFYRRLIASNAALTFPRWRNTQEISAAFHAHVNDASRAVAGIQTFPWADETPNRFFTAPFVLTDVGGSLTTYVTQGAEGGGLLKLDTSEDYDTFLLFARAGETYTIGTDNLADRVDTVIEVFETDSVKAHLVASNDDCEPRVPRSCVSVNVKEDAYLRISVSAHPGTATGPNATYRLYVEREDDFGDTIAAAAPFAADGEMHTSHGELEVIGAVDVFEIPVATAQNLEFVGCSDAAYDVRVELRDAGGALVDWVEGKPCTKGPKSAAVTPGLWYLYVSTPAGVSGSYGLRAGLSAPDIDVDSSPSNAWVLSENGLYSSLFEVASDEDWYAINAGSGQTFIVEAMALDVAVDPEIEIYAPSTTVFGPTGTDDSLPDTSGFGIGHWMLSNNDGSLRPLDARTAFWVPIAGTYYARVRPRPGSSPGRYALLFHDNAGYTDAYPAYP